MSNLENYILIAIILIVPLLAEIKVKSTYNKYLKKENSSGLSGTEVARQILDKNGLSSVYCFDCCCSP